MSETSDTTMADIQDAIRLMRERLTSGQGTEASAACRLSLKMAEALLSAHDSARDTDARHDLAHALYPDAAPAPPPGWDDLIAQVVSLREMNSCLAEQEEGAQQRSAEYERQASWLQAEVERMKAETRHLRQRVFGLEERVHTLRRDLRSIAHHETDDPYRAAAESLDDDNGRFAILAKLEAKDE